MTVNTQTTTSRAAKLGDSAIILAGLVCVVVIAALTWRHTFQLPYYEEWFVAQAVLDHADGNGWPWGLMWAQDVEARHPFSYLYMLPTILWSAMDFRWWTMGNVALAALNAALIARILCGFWNSRATLVWAAAIAALTCTPTNFEAFLNGSYLHARIATTAMLICILTITSKPKADSSPGVYWRWMGASIAAAAAVFSFTFGFFAWALGILALWVTRHDQPPKVSLRLVCLWFVAAATCFALFFWGYQKPGVHANAPATEPVAVMLFFLRLLGAPLALMFLRTHDAATPLLALIFGIATLLVCVALFAYVWKSPELRRRCLPTLLLLFFALMYTGATAASRAMFISPFTSRYYTNVLLILIACTGLAVQLWRLKFPSGAIRYAPMTVTLLGILLACSCLNQYRLHEAEFANRLNYLEQGHAALRDNTDPKLIRRLSPDVEKIQGLYSRLITLRQSHALD